jgi:HSP20 family protein
MVQLVKANDLVEKFIDDDFFDNFFNFSRSIFHLDKYPFTNISTTKDGKLEFEFALAGYSKEDIEIFVNDNVLTVSGKKEEKSEENRRWISKQIAYRDFSVKYMLPNDVDENTISASFEDGIVKVTMNRNMASKTKTIELK